jgi:hypothetical protein
MPDRRSLARWGYMGAGVVGAAVIVYLPLLAWPHRRGPPDPTWIVVVTVAAALAMAWVAGFAVLAFHRLDEFQRAASKFAWYWGGSLGLAVSAPIYLFILLGGLHWLDPAHFHLGAELAVAFRLGYGLAVVSIMLGFIVALGVWRITRR